MLKAILAQAAQPVDADLAKDITADKDWRNDYVDLFGRATLAAASSKEAAIEMARAGLEAMHDTLVLAKDAEHPNAANEVVLSKTELNATRALESQTIPGTAAAERELRGCPTGQATQWPAVDRPTRRAGSGARSSNQVLPPRSAKQAQPRSGCHFPASASR
ncbi:MAG: hypothetical protein R2709_00605 [Marmoricola sp.]